MEMKEIKREETKRKEQKIEKKIKLETNNK